MAQKNLLLSTPPYEVEKALRVLGENLKTARLRRGFTIDEVAQKLGVGKRIISAAEKGKATTSAGIYTGLLWVYGLLDPFTELANPEKDITGIRLAPASKRPVSTKRLDNDF